MIRAATDPTAWAIAMAVAVALTVRPRRPGRRVDAAPIDPALDRSLDDRETAGNAHGSFGRAIGRTGSVNGPASTAEWCEALARSVRGGSSLATALATTPAPVHGGHTVDSLVSTFERTGNFEVPTRGISSHLALALAVVSAALEHGGPCAEPLDRAAGVLRGRAAELAERRVHSAQARLSAQVMSILPIAMLALMVTTSASVRAAVASPAGAITVVMGTAVNLVGWWWMRRIIERSAR